MPWGSGGTGGSSGGKGNSGNTGVESGLPQAVDTMYLMMTNMENMSKNMTGMASHFQDLKNVMIIPW